MVGEARCCSSCRHQAELTHVADQTLLALLAGLGLVAIAILSVARNCLPNGRNGFKPGQ